MAFLDFFQFERTMIDRKRVRSVISRDVCVDNVKYLGSERDASAK